MLALLGHDVDCACYSSYLSERDFEDFTSMFQSFGVERRVHYGTFNKLAENMLNAGGDIREVTCQFMRGETTANKQGKTEARTSARILLIDEVDVFFKSNFYGKTYTPFAKLASEPFATLARNAWECHEAGNKCTYIGLSKTKAFAELCSLHGRNADIIKERLKEMVFALRNLDSHDYIVKDGRIGCVTLL